MRKTLAIALAAMLTAMSLTSVAFAQSSVDGYSPDDGAVQNQIQGNDDPGTSPQASSPGTESSDPGTESSVAPATRSSDSGSLPFTGLDLALLAAAGAVLLGLGLGMRQLTRAPESV